MKRILVTGALGQIGSELIPYLRSIYGENNVLASDLREISGNPICEKKDTFELLDVMHKDTYESLVVKYKIDTIIHMAALLSASAENNPMLAWNLNMTGLLNSLEICRKHNCKFFTPSSIAAFGPNSPVNNTPQDTIQRPTTMYGITKVAGELLCDYYHKKYNVDTRGLRFPGLISYVAEPGGGTTDYAVAIYYEAIRKGAYKCYLKQGTFMDMMYMPDALKSIVELMEVNPKKLIHRNAFNISAMSIAPENIANSIKKIIPNFTLTYEVDPVRQGIADSWPNAINSDCAKTEWGFSVQYDLDKMTIDMLKKLKVKEKIIV